MYTNLVNLGAVVNSFRDFHTAHPFNHCVIDNFFQPEIAEQLASEFMSYDNNRWHFYNNAIENKKACNDWNCFPKLSYSVFSYLIGEDFTRLIGEISGLKLYQDPGLHGGGWHIHGRGGMLNPHFDYNIHPKLGLQRALNIIVYVSPELKEEHGGHLGLWEHNAELHEPGLLVKEIAPKFNRAVIFNTTQNSWHGMSRPLVQPDDIYRKSLAVYYLKEPDSGTEQRGKALFAPTESQKGDESVLELIKLRSNEVTSTQVYRVNK